MLQKTIFNVQVCEENSQTIIEIIPNLPNTLGKRIISMVL